MSIFLYYHNFALLGPFRDMMEGAFMRRVSGVVLGGYAGDAWGVMPEEWESVKNLRGEFAFRVFLLYLCSSGGSTGVPPFFVPGRLGRVSRGPNGGTKGLQRVDERAPFAG